MNDTVKKSLRVIAADRGLAGLIVVNLIAVVIIAVFLLVAIKPNESQVITRYTAYGVANFYRSYWYDLFSYAVLAIIMAVGHSVLSVKLALAKRRDLAMFVLCLTLGLLIILVIFAWSIIKIASLG